MPASRTRLVAAALAAVLALQLAFLSRAGAGTGLPPPTPVPPDASLSPFPTVLHTPSDPAVRPKITAGSAVLADLDSGQVLFHEDPDHRRPIASLTKIMTALLVLERTEPSEVVTVAPDAQVPEDRRGLSELGLMTGEKISVRDLSYALLLQSANDAAIALADKVSGSEKRFVALMNSKAKRLGMRDTKFFSPNGLDDRGYSTANDLVTVTRAAYAASPSFAQIATTRFHSIPSQEGPDREIQNRNVLLWLYPGTIGVKTGYTSKAGFCVVAAAQRGGRRLVAVVLGASGEPFSQAAALLDFGFAAFTQAKLVSEGASQGDVEISGGTVPVRTGDSLEALIPTRSVDDVTRTILVDPGAAYPPAPGERVATLRVALPGLVLGEVPLVVTAVPPPPPLDDPGPWWRRAAGALSRAASGAARGLFG